MKLQQLLNKYDRKKMADSNYDATKLEAFAGSSLSSKKDNKKKKKRVDYEYR